MAESSILWDGEAVGDSGPYPAGAWASFFERMFTTDEAATQGPVEGYLNELEVTGTVTPVQVDTGAAIVKGRPYHSSTAQTFAVPTPVGATRIDRIVLRASWSNNEVRLARLQGNEGTGLPPTPTQIDGDTWEISLAQVEITTGGAISVTDERDFCLWGAVGTPGPDSVDTAQIVDDAVTVAKIQNRTRWFFVPVISTTGDNAWPYENMADSADVSIYTWFPLPTDYVTGLQIQVLVIPKGNGDIYCQYHSNSADDGDAVNANADASGWLTPTVVQDTITLLTAYAPTSDDEEYFGVRFQRDATNILDTVGAAVELVGFLITYTADS